jgi:lipopolysaccharide transport system permease protein
MIDAPRPVPVVTQSTRSRIDLRPIAPVLVLWNHRAIIYRLTVREVLARYRGSMLGLGWSLLVPLATLAAYTFVFSVLLRVRWTATSDSHAEFALVLFAGLALFGIFSESVTRAPGLVLAYANIVKKVVFPAEVLAAVAVAVALFHATIGVAIVLAVAPVAGFGSGWTVLALPAVLLPMLMIALGLTWMLAALGVFFRDMGQGVGLLVTLTMFAIPLFYPITLVPEPFRPYIAHNPLAVLVEESRGILLWASWPDPGRLAVVALLAWAAMWAGYVVFMKLRRGFSDVL